MAAGYERAARSYLESGYFGEAAEAFAAALAEGGGGAEPSALRDYAEGMQAFLERDYARAVERLRRWLDGGAGARAEARRARVHGALAAWRPSSTTRRLRSCAPRRRKLAERIRPFAPRARAQEAGLAL